VTRPIDITPEAYEWADIFCDANIGTPDIDMVARAYMAGQASRSAVQRFGVTGHQLAVLGFTEGYIDQHRGIPPTVREIANHFGFSISKTHGVIDALVDRGCITRLPGRARSLAIVGRA